MDRVSHQELPAVPANRFYVTSGPTMRVSFLEMFVPGGPEYPRAAVTITPENAVELAQMLLLQAKVTKSVSTLPDLLTDQR